MRDSLNIACGDDYRRGWVNADIRTGDVNCSVDSLPFPDNSFRLVYALDILEHFWRDYTYAVLREWRRVLRVGGTLAIRVPNLRTLARVLIDPISPKDRLHAVITNVYGGHRWGVNGELDTHHWGWTPETFKDLLTSNGFTITKMNDNANMTALAIKE